ncbi:ABC transporter (iron.B12.siderophore.hemin), ATP-binding component [Actinokineospora spheciospongiae]|uniref:ABC transporter (Iron.B12.siderophore.hemin), ATP-binding component n=1 Tax=Actinokineospora spheciospongiae TaxID=909613 RepID=W7IJ78_9PSEU|nr:ABC transporter ATP-binding protein [Actinokineospora spheciospongiae]EWC60910.1 ABC transporter (iron.B12.siderophore.hemin), ATP-binding component [Actinokineospora spheciospongiae]
MRHNENGSAVAPRVTAEGVSVSLGGTPIVSDVDFTVGPAEMVAVVGPNGSGKSTLLRAVYRALRPESGVVRVDGADVWSLSARQSAQRTAVVVQESGSDFVLKVADVIAMGRNPHKGPVDRDTDDDRRVCAQAMAKTGVSALAGRDYDTLSGGEKQRVLLARALAQQPRLLVLDEPTNHLDIRFQLELLDLVRGLGVASLTVMHDLALAVGHCDRVYVLHRGRVVAGGPPAEVLTTDLVAEVFGVRSHRWSDPDTGQVHLAFSRLAGAVSPAEPAAAGKGQE